MMQMQAHENLPLIMHCNQIKFNKIIEFEKKPVEIQD